MKEYIIQQNDASQRLDKYLKRRLPQATTAFLYKMLRKKNIVLNDKKAVGNELLTAGDNLKIYLSDETYEKFAGEKADRNADSSTLSSTALSDKRPGEENYLKCYHALKGITVLYENEHVVFLNKPAGILTQKAGKEDMSLNEWLIGYLLTNNKVSEESLAYFRPSVLNRLDRNTSGIVICSKTLPGSRVLSQMLKERSLKKYYRTICYGQMSGNQTVTAWLSKDSKNNKVTIRQSISEPTIKQFTESDIEPCPTSGKKQIADSKSNTEQYDRIITSYQVLQASQDFSYLEIELITGKTHQIRAQLQALGHPLLGDHKYGNEKQKEILQKHPLMHQLLHAYRLEFPKMEEEFSDLSEKIIICPEPEEFMQIKKNLDFS